MSQQEDDEEIIDLNSVISLSITTPKITVYVNYDFHCDIINYKELFSQNTVLVKEQFKNYYTYISDKVQTFQSDSTICYFHSSNNYAYARSVGGWYYMLSGRIKFHRNVVISPVEVMYPDISILRDLFGILWFEDMGGYIHELQIDLYPERTYDLISMGGDMVVKTFAHTTKIISREDYIYLHKIVNDYFGISKLELYDYSHVFGVEVCYDERT